jgi:hypothetical protein
MSRKIPKKNSKTKKKPINNSRRYKLYNEIRKITKKHPKIKQNKNSIYWKILTKEGGRIII